MTGAYVRVKRDGRWENVEVDRLTDGELDALECRSADDGLAFAAGEGWMWAKLLARWIRENVHAGDEAEGV